MTALENQIGNMTTTRARCHATPARRGGDRESGRGLRHGRPAGAGAHNRPRIEPLAVEANSLQQGLAILRRIAGGEQVEALR